MGRLNGLGPALTGIGADAYMPGHITGLGQAFGAE